MCHELGMELPLLFFYVDILLIHLVANDYLQMTVRDALNSALDEEMSSDSKVFIMGEEVKYILM